uniref:Reticulon n=1 Tax=Aquila chrysaetos chrysaetos TaxID=223781 RepID=A0A663FJQ2_AQUCH
MGMWELLYWQAPGRSALALVGVLGTLGCLARFSAVSVGAYGALAVLGVTLPLRLHRAALQALRQHPPEAQPEGTVGLSPEEQQRWARRLAQHVTTATRTLTRLFLVHSLPESLKFAALFYLLTYVGAVCNGLTLLGAGTAQIDQYVSLVRNHLSHLRGYPRGLLGCPGGGVGVPRPPPPTLLCPQDPGQAPKCQSEAVVTPRPPLR